MTTDGFRRKLTAILSADVAGYSRLMGDDESNTVRTLTKYKELIFNWIERNNGRVIDSPGDNVLAEFASVVNAVQCGVQIQEDLKRHNEELPVNRKMEFRIGINTGDVIQNRNKIYGDGVNVAARIEALTDPGGIFISGIVYTQIKNKLHFDYEFIGKHAVKNISEPVPVYRVKMLTKPRIHMDTNNDSTPIPSGKPSIVVLPFINMSNDPEQEYFSDGISEEIIYALAKLKGLKVISRTSAFFFKGKDVNLRIIGKELNVEHVLEGSVRKAGNQLRITAQLIKVADDENLWSEAYYRELEDVFTIQEEISSAIVESLKVKLLRKDKALVKTYTENIEAYEAYIKGRYFYLNFKKGSMEKALQFYNQAATLDPDFAPAYSAIAEYYVTLPGTGQKKINIETYNYYRKEARKAIRTALEIDYNLPEAHANLGLIKHFHEWDWKGAEKAFETAINLNPGLSKPHYDYALYLSTIGESDLSILEARKAVALDPLNGLPHFNLGVGLCTSGKVDQALREIQQAREMMPSHIIVFTGLVSTYILKGMLEKTIEEINEGLEAFSRHPLLLSQLGHAYAQKGEKGKTQEILDELLERPNNEYMITSAISTLYADLGEIDLAFKYLEKAYDKHDIFLTIFKIAPPENLLVDPRFEAFLKKMRL